mmetsp:Transcript_53764/g.156260  ORF Transcript_53764/g.156260 Transcript_53764/m.156260 type:complete len:149 (-) Transcript_53764:27-473(-)
MRCACNHLLRRGLRRRSLRCGRLAPGHMPTTSTTTRRVSFSVSMLLVDAVYHSGMGVELLHCSRSATVQEWYPTDEGDDDSSSGSGSDGHVYDLKWEQGGMPLRVSHSTLTQRSAIALSILWKGETTSCATSEEQCTSTFGESSCEAR